MAILREKLLSNFGGVPWEVPALVQRLVGGPLDKSSVFFSYDDAAEYAKNNVLAYPGQLIVVVPETGDVTGYVILADGTLQRLAVDADLALLRTEIAALFAVLDINYDNKLAFDIEELVVDFTNVKAILGTAVLGQMILGRAK